MIDLRTDEGVREALRSIAAWPPPATPAAAAPTAPAPLPRPARQRPSARWAVAAAILTIGLIAAALVTVGRDRTSDYGGTWEPIAASPLEARFAPISLWMGDRLLIWGGHDAQGDEVADGATYDPATDRWDSIAIQPFPYARRSGAAVDAEEGSWSTFPTPGAWFDGKAWFVLSSPDEEWGWDLVTYDPARDRWERVDRARFDQQPNDALVMTEGTATVQSPVALVEHDGQLVVFGWHSQRSEYGWAGFDPTTKTWGDFSGVPGSGLEYGLTWSTPGPIVIDDHYLTWVSSQGLDGNPRFGFTIDLDTGQVQDVEPPVDQEIVWLSGLDANGTTIGVATAGGLANGRRFSARLDPSTGTWRSLPALPSGPAEAAHDGGAPAVVATGDRAVVVGGLDRRYEVGGLRSTHGDHVLVKDRWESLPDAPIDLSRASPTAVWTGSVLLVWGGTALPDAAAPTATVPLADGARFIAD